MVILLFEVSYVIQSPRWIDTYCDSGSHLIISFRCLLHVHPVLEPFSGKNQRGQLSASSISGKWLHCTTDLCAISTNRTIFNANIVLDFVMPIATYIDGYTTVIVAIQFYLLACMEFHRQCNSFI